MSDNLSEPSYANEIPIVNNFNLRNYFSPLKSPTCLQTQASTPIMMPTFTDLDSNVRQLFNSKILAALTNRDSILREIRDCIISNDEERCRKDQLAQGAVAYLSSIELQSLTAVKRQLQMYSMLHIPEVGA